MYKAETGRKGQQSNRTVFLGGIPLNSTKHEVLSYLEQFDIIQKLEMPKDKYLKTLKGYAKAVFQTTEGVDRLLAQPCHFLRNLQLSVKKWTNKTDYLSQKDQISKRKLFVRYHPNYHSSALLDHFEIFGTVENLDMKTDPKTNNQRFIAYVTYSSEREAQNAAKYGLIAESNRYIYCEITTPSYIMTFENKTSLCGSPTLKSNANTTKKGTLPSFEPFDDQRHGSFASDSMPAKQYNMKKEIKSASQVKKRAGKPSANEFKQYFGSITSLSKKAKTPGGIINAPREKLSSAPVAKEFFQFHDTKPTSRLYVYPTAQHNTMANVMFRKLIPRPVSVLT